jgi:hypothetical protein
MSREYIGEMRRLFHTALGVWFLIVITMAQGCAGPAQSAGSLGARDATSAGRASNDSSSQFAYATAPQNSSQNSSPADTTGYVADTGASTALTDYLKHHRLPLVGAQVMRDPNNGGRTVVLYGFVGSDLGKSDAQRRAEDFINDPAVDVDNRIRVNPELLAAGPSSPDSSAPDSAASADDGDAQAQANASAAMPGAQAYVDQQNQASQIQQYQQQNSMATMNSMLPLIALLGILAMANSGGGFSTGPPMSFSPFGRSPYSSPYGSSPYGPSPYGNSPYGPYSGYPPPNSGYAPAPSTFGRPGYASPGGGVTPFGSLPGSPY